MVSDIDFQEWLCANNIKILDKSKRRPVYNTTTQYFQNQDDYNTVYTHRSTDTEPIFTLEMSESGLRKMFRFEQQVFNNRNSGSHYNLFDAMMQLKYEEKQLRESNEAVQKAYEHYSLMLMLAKNTQ